MRAFIQESMQGCIAVILAMHLHMATHATISETLRSKWERLLWSSPEVLSGC